MGDLLMLALIGAGWFALVALVAGLRRLAPAGAARRDGR